MGIGRRLARKAIRNLVPYRSARSLVTAGEIFLDANEAPTPPLEGEGMTGLNRYPEPQPAALVSALSSLYRVAPNRLFVGRGADEAMDTLLRTYCEAREDAILITPPTYGYYRIAAAIQGADIVEVPLLRNGKQFELDVDGMVKAWHEKVKLVFVCSPNNPTGTDFDEERILALLRAMRERAIVVLDEAYVEFAERPSFAGRLDEFDNLVVLRTLSKAWGLAGARCGVALAGTEIVDLLQRVRAPYPLPLPSVRLVERALDEGRAAVDARIEKVRRERTRLAEALVTCPDVVDVFPSDANFLLLQTKRATTFVERCARAGIVVRDRSAYHGLGDCVRVSVGGRDENDRLLAVLREEAVR